MALGPCRFTNALAGTVDWTYPGPAIDLQSPTSAGAVNGTVYEYYAQSLDMGQWEIGTGAYNSGTGVFARTAISANSLGTTAKISFLNPPEIAFYDLYAVIAPATAIPLAAATPGVVGASAKYAREDHQHPNDVTKVGVIKKQVFTASGTYTPSANLLYAIIEGVGSGAGGGGVVGGAALSLGGGGGGSGSYSRLVASAATIGASQAVTIGAAGAGVSGANGTDGADVSVGTLLVAKGGSKGFAGLVAQLGVGGVGGVPGTGDLTAAGASGTPGGYNGARGTVQVIVAPGTGGSSYFGGGAASVAGSGVQTLAGANAGNYGSGGSGAFTDATASNAAGGNGSKGAVFITEFCAA